MPDTASTIIDNREGNTLLAALQTMGDGGREIAIATAFFSLDALLLLADSLSGYERVRILFGDDASPRQRVQLLEKLRARSDADLLIQRESAPLLTPLQQVGGLFAAGRVEARCYTANKFHAKAYGILRPDIYPSQMAILGSGNFTRPGLLQNVELNVELTPEQTAHLLQWYEDRWDEAVEDVVTEDVLAEIVRQIKLYDPYYIYLKALYEWGQYRQGAEIDQPSEILAILDKHQEDGYFQALKIAGRENGVMVCDGVGLGKSFIALALMEHYCREGKKVLLLAPKNILDNSWHGYLRQHLRRFRRAYESMKALPMTALGFDPEDTHQDNEDLVDDLMEQADVVVIDESHNFRTRSANRYVNLYKIIAPANGRRKKVVMLTATPLNTHYADISSQLALITHEAGSIGGYRIEQIRKAASELDKDRPEVDFTGQLSLELNETPNDTLNRVLENVVIQRSRKTCKELSRVAGRELRFPIRKGPECVEYQIGAESRGYSAMIDRADRRFRPGVRYLDEVRQALREKPEGPLPARLRKGPEDGITLAAFWTENYRYDPLPGSKQYQDEVQLAGLVYSNTLKQLESSPAAFQGIIQSLGEGLLARLEHVFGEAASGVVARHQSWARTPIFASPDSDNGDGDADVITDGEALDASGEETDAWLRQAIRSRGLERKLDGFVGGAFDVDHWRRDIESDLGFLQEVHASILEARKQPDPKLRVVCPMIESQVREGKRVLVFTQSRRTADYLERELRMCLSGHRVERIDSTIEGDRRTAIVHGFCPSYNDPPTRGGSGPAVDVLISTDVLSEGVNLQETGAILNYDIHWNPVRLIQRIGRVDRRLDPAKTPHEHEFTILNVLPPDEINKVIHLVGTVERRTLKISRALGIDVSFFRATDPAGTLIEFNALYEGEMRKRDVASANYIHAFSDPDPRLMAFLARIPPGAFGVWDRAPFDGLFALFTVQATDRASDADKARFEQVIGRPVLALERTGGGSSFDAGEILELLSGTVEGERSGTPSDEESLATRLQNLRNAARQQFADIDLPREIKPRLVCWMELRKGGE